CPVPTHIARSAHERRTAARRRSHRSVPRGGFPMSKAGHKQLEVQIMGQSYLLSCPTGGEALLLEAVERVDTAMCRIRDAGKVKARDRIAVLASLNLAYELSQMERKQAERDAESQQFQASSF